MRDVCEQDSTGVAIPVLIGHFTACVNKKSVLLRQLFLTQGSDHGVNDGSFLGSQRVNLGRQVMQFFPLPLTHAGIYAPRV